MLNIVQNIDWFNISELLKNSFGNDIYNAWLSKLNFVSCDDNIITLSVGMPYLKEYIENNFLNGIRRKNNGVEIWVKKGIKQILYENFGISSITIIVDNAIKSNAVLSNTIISNEDTNVSNNIVSISQYNNLHTIGTDLNKLFTFENYVVGESNKLAYSIAKSIVNDEDIGIDVNPLFLYSEVGLGKTHLVQAMAWELKNKYKNKNIVYLSAEKFMLLFVQSLQNNDINKFKDQFRNIDILLIDDIQFIAGKEGTQKEFFYTFNTLLSENKKIILACNKAPDNMEYIDIQLKSRMTSGIVVNIDRPNYDMRFQLAKKKAEILGLQCPDSILEYIAHNITTTNRDIEGAIKKLLVHQKFMNYNITIDVVNNILKDTLQATKKFITIEQIQQKVADFYKITKSELLSDRRDKKYSLPRQVAFYLSKHITKKSFPEIGRYFGNKNHATVIFACNKIKKELLDNIEIINAINYLEKELNNY